MVDLGKIASAGKETVSVGVEKIKGLFLNGKIFVAYLEIKF